MAQKSRASLAPQRSRDASSPVPLPEPPYRSVRVELDGLLDQHRVSTTAADSE